MARNVDLDNPQEVELVIARLKKTDPSTKKLTNIPISNTYKAKLYFTYKHYAKFYEIFWEVPHYIEEASVQEYEEYLAKHTEIEEHWQKVYVGHLEEKQ